MMYRPKIIINPKTTSYKIIFLPYKIGSSNEAKKAPVDKQASVTEIFDTLIALKKVNQCNAMMSPAKRY